MIEAKQRSSRETVDSVMDIINQMVENDEEVKICSLMKKTGCSRSLFYNNQEIKAAVERAKALQQGKSYSSEKNVVINKSMEKDLERLKKRCERLEAENEELRKENERLKKAADAKMIKLISKL